MDHITKRLKGHYSRTFDTHGAVAEGVDWRSSEELATRYGKMLKVMEDRRHEDPPSILDVGCGYGGLYQHARERGISLRYTGIDVVEAMVEHAASTYDDATFHCADVFDFQPQDKFDYVTCNGILTLKLAATSIREMDRFAQSLINRLYELCLVGAVFNTRTTKVDSMLDFLYYRNPIELLAWCISEVSDRVVLDHSYLSEYCIYLYRDEEENRLVLPR
jgi:SAM-dependent methyltransferase